jgi:hypothetical protein
MNDVVAFKSSFEQQFDAKTEKHQQLIDSYRVDYQEMTKEFTKIRKGKQ